MLVSDDRDEGGFTVVELAIVMAMAMLVMSSLLGMLTSQSKATTRLDRFANNQEQVRLAMVAMQKDLRSSERLLELPAGADIRYRVDLERYVDAAAVEPETISWRITADGELVRYLVRSATDLVATHRLAGTANVERGVALFTHVRASGTPYATTESARTVADCSVKVQLRLQAAPESGPAPMPLSSAVQLRNRISSVGEC